MKQAKWHWVGDLRVSRLNVLLLRHRRCSPVQGEEVRDAVVAHVVKAALVLHVLDEHAELCAPVTLHNIRPGQQSRRTLTHDSCEPYAAQA